MFANNKVALVTGGAQGIGLGITKELLKNGAKGVAIVDIDGTSGTEAVRELTETLGFANKAIFIKTDITNGKEFEDAFKKTIETFKQLDIVFNNAGAIGETNWEKVVAVNLTATVRGSYLAMLKYLPKYRSGSEGVIINTASLAALQLYPNLPTYTISKSGTLAIGRVLGCKEFYDKYKVRIITICPGGVATGIFKNFMDPGEIFFEESRSAIFEDIKALQTPETIGQEAMKILDTGRTGSIWVIENLEPAYEVTIPDRNQSYRQNVKSSL